MTGCISIWVKNLANVESVVGWVSSKGATQAGRDPACVLFSCWLVILLFSVSLCLRLQICICNCPSVCLSV